MLELRLQRFFLLSQSRRFPTGGGFEEEFLKILLGQTDPVVDGIAGNTVFIGTFQNVAGLPVELDGG